MKKITLLAMSLFMALTVKAQDTGTDITGTFENTDFESNSATGWTTTGWIQSTAPANNYQGTYYLETWTESAGNLSNFDWFQTKSVPNGYYIIKALAHAIKQDQPITPESKGVFFYAEDDQVEIKSTVAEEYTLFIQVTDGNLTIGYRAVDCNVNWTAVDYFRIIQCYGDTEDAAKTSWLKCEMLQMQEELESLLENPMNADLRDAIYGSFDIIESVATYAEADALWSTMKEQAKEAEACVVAYEKLILKIEEVYEIADAGDYTDDLYDAVDAVDAKYEDELLSAAEALAEIDVLTNAVFDYNLENADGSTAFSVTDKFMTNPTLRENSNGWSGSKPGLEHQVMEFYDCDFDICQELTDIPNGKYVVKVQGFYREAGNDAGAAYAAGTEDITAQLYANSASAPLLSLYAYTASEMGVSVDVLSNYVNSRYSANSAFSMINPLTEQNYYEENAVTVIVMDGKLKLGLRNVGHKGSSWCAFRDFQLFYYGNFPAVNLQGKMNAAREYLIVNEDKIPTAVYFEIDEYLYENEHYAQEGAYSDDEVNAVILEFDAMWAEALKAVDLFAALKDKVADIKDNLIPLDFPGVDDLLDLVDEVEAFFDPECEENTYEALLALEARLNEGIRAYYLSQEASETVSADFTYFVSNPNFEEQGEWTWSMTAAGTDQWIGGCRPTEAPVEGEAEKPRQGINLWGHGITSIDVHQTLTGLPNGLYKVSAELITEPGYATDQHVYAIASDKVVSENLTVEGWDTYEWTTLTTNDYAVVVDGTLTIGAASSKGGTDAEGWFQATNFKLYYHGSYTLPVKNFVITDGSDREFSLTESLQCNVITYTRCFGDTNWQPLYVPFEIPVDKWLLEDYEFADLNNVHQYDRNDDGVTDETVIEAFKVASGTLEANYPYLIRAKEAGEKSIVVTDAMLYTTEKNSIDCSSVRELFTFTGTYSTLSSDALPQAEGYYTLNGGVWQPVAEGESLGAFRFYLKVDSRGGNAAMAPSIRMRIVSADGSEEDGTTGIAHSTLNPQRSTIYDLMGRKVTDAENLKGGVYIVNGKKVVK